MLRIFLPLTLAATLLAPLTVSAQTAVSPVPPATPAPTPPAAPKPHDHIGGKITAVDAAKKTVTVTRHDKDMILTIASDAKIYKIGEHGKNAATGSFADLAVGTLINAHITGDEAAPTANEVHLRAPKNDTKPTPPATVPPTPPAP